MWQCRFTDRDKRELDDLWATDRLGRRQLQKARAGAMVAPPPPPQEIQDAMSSVVLRERQRHERPFWLGTLCLHRDVFANTALVVILDGGVQLVLKLSYALQSPYFAAFSPMELVEEPFQAMPMTSETYNEMAGDAWLQKYRCDYANIVAYNEIGDVTPSELWVLPGLCCLGGDLVASDQRLVQWAFFAEGLPAAKVKQPSDKKSQPTSAKGITAEMLQEHPCLQAFVEKQHQKQKSRSSKDPTGGKGSECGGEDGAAEAEGLAEDKVEAVFKELHEKRQAWLDTAPVATTDFRTSILGGAWTKAKKSVAYDYFCGPACTTAAEQ